MAITYGNRTPLGSSAKVAKPRSSMRLAVRCTNVPLHLT